LIGFVVGAVAIVAIARRRVEVRVAAEVVRPLVAEMLPLLTKVLDVLLFKAILRVAVLKTQLFDALWSGTLVLVEMLTVLRDPLLPLLDQLLLALWRQRLRGSLLRQRYVLRQLCPGLLLRMWCLYLWPWLCLCSRLCVRLLLWLHLRSRLYLRSWLSVRLLLWLHLRPWLWLWP